MIEVKCDACQNTMRLVDPPGVEQLRAKLDCARKALEAADCYCAKGRSTVGANSLCRNCEALAQINAGAGEETSDECACTTRALNGAPWTCPHGNKFNQAHAQQEHPLPGPQRGKPCWCPYEPDKCPTHSSKDPKV